MKQTRRMSLVEALANVAVGYGVAVLTQIAVFPLFGLQVSLSDNLLIGALFTGVSVARSYALRRVFERKMRPDEDPVARNTTRISRMPLEQRCTL
jgi:hypothetical protein